MRLEDADRLRTLLDTGIAISSELSLDAVLERIVEAAASLTGARYAALGVIDPSGTGLERFVFTGIEQREADAIGDLPRGRGILGVLIEDARPLRLHDLGDHPRSVGFPPNHPRDADVPGRADPAARRRLRKPLPDREGGWGGLQPG